MSKSLSSSSPMRSLPSPMRTLSSHSPSSNKITSSTPLTRHSSNSIHVHGNNYAGSDDDYLSDVPSQTSSQTGGQSEMSDVVVSTHAIERMFKDKYRSLRNAYEQRIRQLSTVVTDACAGLYGDELLEELKSDKASSIFIPAHLSEIMDKHLENERENFIHQIVGKLSNLEVDLSKSQEVISAQSSKIKRMEAELLSNKRIQMALDPMNEKLLKSEEQLKQLQVQSTQQIESLSNTNHSLQEKIEELTQVLALANEDNKKKADECYSLQSLLKEKTNSAKALETSFEETAYSLAILENAEQQERLLRKDMKEQLKKVLEERDICNVQVYELNSELRYKNEENLRLQSVLTSKIEEEAKSKERLGALMAQVESMLAQEAAESNAAILAVHDRMKQFRHRLMLELQREKRISSAFQDELLVLRAYKEDKIRESKFLLEEETILKSKLAHEEQRCQALLLQSQELSSQLAEMKVKFLDTDAKLRNTLDKISDIERSKREEIKMIEDRCKFAAEREIESERNQMEQRTNAFQLHLRNEMALMAGLGVGGGYSANNGNVNLNALRHSYTFGSNENSIPFNSNTEMMVKSAKEEWTRERAEILDKYELQMKSLHSHLASEKDRVVLLQQKLADASDNISRLKHMVENGRNEQNDKNDIDSLKLELEQRGEEVSHLKTLNNNLKGQLYVEKKTIDEKEAEIVRLNKLLKQCQEQALNDQANDAAALEDMQNKFHMLMQHYEKATAQKQESAIQLENNKASNSSQLETASTSSSSSKGFPRDLPKLLHTNMTKVKELRSNLNSLRSLVIGKGSVLATDIHRISDEINVKLRECVSASLKAKQFHNVASLEAVILGMINALKSLKVLPDDAALQLLNLSQDKISSESQKALLVSAADVRVTSSLKSFIQFHEQSLRSELDSIKNNIKSKSLTATNAIDDSAKQDQAMLMELSKLESDQQVKSLLARIDSMKRNHANELAVLKHESSSLESSLKKALEDELASCRQEEIQRTASIVNQLKNEQNRRQQLQIRCQELEKTHAHAVMELEKQVLINQQRADTAELEILKLRRIGDASPIKR